MAKTLGDAVEVVEAVLDYGSQGRFDAETVEAMQMLVDHAKQVPHDGHCASCDMHACEENKDG